VATAATRYALSVEMRWKVRIDGSGPALAHLRRDLPAGDVVVRDDTWASTCRR
jgi:hypothetical protein